MFVGALIVIERDIKIKDIISTGIIMDAEISPQLLVNIFTPKTPLHVVIIFFINIFFKVSSLTSAINVPSFAIEIFPVSSDTTTAIASDSFDIPIRRYKE